MRIKKMNYKTPEDIQDQFWQDVKSTMPNLNEFLDDHYWVVRDIIRYDEAFADVHHKFDVIAFADVVEEDDVEYSEFDPFYCAETRGYNLTARKSRMVIKRHSDDGINPLFPSTIMFEAGRMNCQDVGCAGGGLNWMYTVFQLYTALVTGGDPGVSLDNLCKNQYGEYPVNDEWACVARGFDNRGLEIFIDGVLKSWNRRLIRALVCDHHEFIMVRVVRRILELDLDWAVWLLPETVYLSAVEWFNHQARQYELQVKLVHIWNDNPNPNRVDPMDKFKL